MARQCISEELKEQIKQAQLLHHAGEYAAALAFYEKTLNLYPEQPQLFLLKR